MEDLTTDFRTPIFSTYDELSASLSSIITILTFSIHVYIATEFPLPESRFLSVSAREVVVKWEGIFNSVSFSALSNEKVFSILSLFLFCFLFLFSFQCSDEINEFRQFVLTVRAHELWDIGCHMTKIACKCCILKKKDMPEKTHENQSGGLTEMRGPTPKPRGW